MWLHARPASLAAGIRFVGTTVSETAMLAAWWSTEDPSSSSKLHRIPR